VTSEKGERACTERTAWFRKGWGGRNQPSGKGPPFSETEVILGKLREKGMSQKTSAVVSENVARLHPSRDLGR